MRHFLLICLLLIITSPVHAEKYSAEVWTKTFYAMSEDDAFLAKTNPYQKNSPLFNIHRDYQRDSFRNEKFVAKLISTLNVQEGSVQDSRTLGVAMAEEIVMSGIKKLNDGDKERLLSYPYFKCLS